MTTTVVDALGAGPDLRANEIVTLNLATLRHDIGELVLEL